MSVHSYVYANTNHKIGAKENHVNIVEGINVKMLIISRVDCRKNSL